MPVITSVPLWVSQVKHRARHAVYRWLRAHMSVSLDGHQQRKHTGSIGRQRRFPLSPNESRRVKRMSRVSTLPDLSKYNHLPTIVGIPAAARYCTEVLNVETTATTIKRCVYHGAQPMLAGRVLAGKLRFSERELVEWIMAAPSARESKTFK